MRDPNFYSDEGTVAHALAAMCLREGKPARAYIGRVIRCEDYEHAGLSPSSAHRWMRCPGSHSLEGEYRKKFKLRRFSQQVTQEMADAVQVYLDNLLANVKPRGAKLLVEHVVPIGNVTDEKNATGTADAVILDHDAFELQAHDLKFGKGVEVSAEENEQLGIYLLGLLEEFGEFYDWQRFRGVIHQPRINEKPSDYVWYREDLEAFREKVKDGAASATYAKAAYSGPEDKMWEDSFLHPGDKQCRFCSAKPTCPAYRKFVSEKTMTDIDLLDNLEAQVTADALVPIPADNLTLARDLHFIPLIRQWCDAREAHAESLMLQGQEMPGWKLVEGRRGNRVWINSEEAESMLKSMRYRQDEMYSMKVISPTQAEKLVQPKQWKRLEELITQSNGTPQVVPEQDKRPALDVKAPAKDVELLDNLNEEKQ